MQEINVRKFNFLLILLEKNTKLKQKGILYELFSSRICQELVVLTFTHRKDFSKKKMNKTKEKF